MLVLRRLILTALTFAIFHTGSALISWVLVPRLLARVAKASASDRQREIEAFFFARDRWIVQRLVGFGLLTLDMPVVPEWLLRGGPYMVVCNHPSLVDVLLVRSVIPGLTCVVKHALYHRWHIEPMLRAGGDFPGPATHGELELGQTAVLDRFVDKLKSGRSVLVFPEGTRSPARSLRRFRRGAIEAAIRANVPVVPLFLAVDPPVLTKEDTFSAIGRQRACARLTILPPIVVSGGDSRQITRDLQQRYEALIAQEMHSTSLAQVGVSSAADPPSASATT